MNSPVLPTRGPPHFMFDHAITLALRWTPRAIMAGLGGYYSLGIAYDHGVMAALDRVAIALFRRTMGHVGMGAFMPTFQWYSAWGVRFIAAIGAGILYDLAERTVFAAAYCLRNRALQERPLTPAPRSRPNQEMPNNLNIKTCTCGHEKRETI